MMDLTQLVNLGAFIGGVAVLVTLVCLAAQVRQTNKRLRFSVQQYYRISCAARSGSDLSGLSDC